MPGRKPGTPKTGGRRVGTKNRIPQALKDMVLGALAAKKGQKWLEQQMDKNPVAFMSLLGRILPTTVGADPDNPHTVLFGWMKEPPPSGS